MPWTATLVSRGTTACRTRPATADRGDVAALLRRHAHRARLRLTVPRLVHRCSCGRTGCTRSTASGTGAPVVRRTTNVKLFNDLLGDSSFIVGYLRAMGYDLRGPPDGLELRQRAAQDTPYLRGSGPGRWSPTGSRSEHRRTQHVVPHLAVNIGERNYLGNALAWPAGARVGDNCPARDESRASARRAGPPQRRACWVARVRDPADGAARRRRAARGRGAAPRPPQEPLQRGTIALFTMVRWFRSFVVW